MSKKTNKQELENIYFTLTGTRVQFKTILECLQKIYLAYGGTEQLKDTNAEMLALIATVAKAGESDIDPAIVKYGEIVDEKAGITGLLFPVPPVDEYVSSNSVSAMDYLPRFMSDNQIKNNIAPLWIKNNLKFINEKIMTNKITKWFYDSYYYSDPYFMGNNIIYSLPDLTNLVNISGLFYDFKGEIIPDFQNSVELNEMLQTFRNCSNLKAVPKFTIPNNNVNTESAFMGCEKLEDITALRGIKTYNCINMFRDCYSLVDASILTFPKQTPEQTVMLKETFEDCHSLKIIPDFSKVIIGNLYSAFNKCQKLTEVNGLNTQKVIDFGLAFGNCINLKTVCDLDLSSIGKGSNYGGENMFYGCKSLTTFTDSALAPEGSRWQFKGKVVLNNPLDKSSILKVFNGLTDSSADGGYAIVISSTTNSYLSETDKAIATGKGWTISVV